MKHVLKHRQSRDLQDFFHFMSFTFPIPAQSILNRMVEAELHCDVFDGSHEWIGDTQRFFDNLLKQIWDQWEKEHGPFALLLLLFMSNATKQISLRYAASCQCVLEKLRFLFMFSVSIPSASLVLHCLARRWRTGRITYSAFLCPCAPTAPDPQSFPTFYGSEKALEPLVVLES